jgi:hypothetical protein
MFEHFYLQYKNSWLYVVSKLDTIITHNEQSKLKFINVESYRGLEMCLGCEKQGILTDFCLLENVHFED